MIIARNNTYRQCLYIVSERMYMYNMYVGNESTDF